MIKITGAKNLLTLHPQVRDKIDQVSKIVIETQEPGVRIIDKTGPLSNPADRDHCIQYMTAVPLIYGRLTGEDYEDRIANDPRIDALRSVMEVKENPTFTLLLFWPRINRVQSFVSECFLNTFCGVMDTLVDTISAKYSDSC